MMFTYISPYMSKYGLEEGDVVESIFIGEGIKSCKNFPVSIVTGRDPIDVDADVFMRGGGMFLIWAAHEYVCS